MKSEVGPRAPHPQAPIRAFSQSKADRHDGHADQHWSFINVLFEHVSSTRTNDLPLTSTKARVVCGRAVLVAESLPLPCPAPKIG